MDHNKKNNGNEQKRLTDAERQALCRARKRGDIGIVKYYEEKINKRKEERRAAAQLKTETEKQSAEYRQRCNEKQKILRFF